MVQVGGVVLAPASPELGDKGEFVTKAREREIRKIDKALEGDSAAYGFISMILGCSIHEAEKLLERKDDDTEIIVRAKLIAKTKNKEWRQKFYRDVESVVQGMDHRDIKLSTTNGTINGQKAILSDGQKFPMIGSLPELNEAWKILTKVYARWVEDDKIHH